MDPNWDLLIRLIRNIVKDIKKQGEKFQPTSELESFVKEFHEWYSPEQIALKWEERKKIERKK